MQSQKLTVTQATASGVAPAGAGFGSTQAHADRATVEHLARHDRAATVGTWIGSGLAKLIASIRAANRRRQAMAELAALDNRMLADIGISRSEIRAAVSSASGFMPRALNRSSAASSFNDDVVNRVA
ncbi:DUF1127 domain-containing protein [Vineibacter terrae]|uniref:DUF1127 domain-containing protein n=1 Tax=Vineibacter terrae TaxID=2586908 RepID=A0A5C8PJK3_9HYPH|nr:DUF1127 domain-containing protein [Vineibacter terrae]